VAPLHLPVFETEPPSAALQVASTEKTDIEKVQIKRPHHPYVEHKGAKCYSLIFVRCRKSHNEQMMLEKKDVVAVVACSFTTRTDFTSPHIPPTSLTVIRFHGASHKKEACKFRRPKLVIQLGHKNTSICEQKNAGCHHVCERYPLFLNYCCSSETKHVDVSFRHMTPDKYLFMHNWYRFYDSYKVNRDVFIQMKRHAKRENATLGKTSFFRLGCL